LNWTNFYGRINYTALKRLGIAENVILKWNP
jgi:hypothetical protein